MQRKKLTLLARAADAVVGMPARSDFVFRLARRIVHRHQGENDSRMERNGELRVLRSVLPKCRVVFDVGANVGEWARNALAINPKLELHCFEPNPASFAELSGVPGHLSNVAVGAETGILPFNIYSERSEENSLHQRHGYEPIRVEQVPVITLDGYGVEQIDLLKIDVEGHEIAVLQGAKRLLAEGRIKCVQFEYSACYTAARALLRDAFDALPGYEVFKILPNGLWPVEYSQELENYQYANFLAQLVRQP